MSGLYLDSPLAILLLTNKEKNSGDKMENVQKNYDTPMIYSLPISYPQMLLRINYRVKKSINILLILSFHNLHQHTFFGI